MFFALYAGIDGFKFKENPVPFEKREEIDRWILSKLNSLVANYEKLMDDYDVTRAARSISEFTIDHLSNWYVRRCRRRFWKSEMNENKLAAYQTLYECLETICKLTAPFAPFISEEIYQNLNRVTKKEKFESVHLSDFPVMGKRDTNLELKMDVAQHIVYITRAIRAKSNLKVRQPLEKILVSVDEEKKEAVINMKKVILDEVNVKSLEILEDESSIIKKSAKPDFKTIGPKFGKNAKLAAERIKKLSNIEIGKIEKGLSIDASIEGENLLISPDDVEILKEEIEGWVVESEGGTTVAVNTELTEDLIAEGLAREFVNRIQNMRKDAGFEVTDKIKVLYTGTNKLTNAIKVFTNYISTETLAEKLENTDNLNGGVVRKSAKKAAKKNLSKTPKKKITKKKTAVKKKAVKKATRPSKQTKKKIPLKRPRIKRSTSVAEVESTVESRAKAIKKIKGYSKKELEHFKTIILEKRDEIIEQLQNLREQMLDPTTGEYINENSPYSLHMAEQGTDAMEREKTFLYAQRENKFLGYLEDALKRIETGIYGICIECIDEPQNLCETCPLIPKERLEAVPHSQHCLPIKQRQEKK